MTVCRIAAALASCSVVWAVGCTKKNPAYCEDSSTCPNGTRCDLELHTCFPEPDAAVGATDAGIDARAFDAGGGGCESSLECENDTAPICDATDMVCRGCDADGECAGLDPLRPICAGDGHCAACTDHAECDTGACDTATGACVPEDDIVYVDASGSASGTCGTSVLPCATLTLGAGKLTPTRTYIKMAPGSYTAEPARIVFDGDTAHIIATGVDFDCEFGLWSQGGADVTIEGMLARGCPLAGLSVRDATSKLTLRAMTVRDGTSGANVHSVGGALVVEDSLFTSNPGLPILTDPTAEPATTVTIVRRTTISNNGSAIGIGSGTFEITNNMIVNNVSGSVGPKLSFDGETSGTFAFNTVTGNEKAASGIDDGVDCSEGGGLASVDADSNIVYDNTPADFADPACTWSYSNIEELVASGISGPGNIDTPPQFVAPLATPPDYHLQASSIGRDLADPGSTVADDIDGEARPNGARADMGADEIYP